MEERFFGRKRNFRERNQEFSEISDESIRNILFGLQANVIQEENSGKDTGVSENDFAFQTLLALDDFFEGVFSVRDGLVWVQLQTGETFEVRIRKCN